MVIDKYIVKGILGAIGAIFCTMAIYYLIGSQGVSYDSEYNAWKEQQELIARGPINELEFKADLWEVELSRKEQREVDDHQINDLIRKEGRIISWLPWLAIALFIGGPHTKIIVGLVTPPVILAFIGFSSPIDILIFIVAILVGRVGYQYKQNLTKVGR
jgi:hypothetical protein